MKSISLKIIIIIIAALAVLNTSVLLLANWQIRKIITKNQVDLRTEQIGQIIAYIKSKHNMLKKKGLLEAMGSNARDGILRDLNKIWYNNRDAFGNPTTEKDKIAKGEEILVYPYIMNQNGKLILHPYLPEDKRDVSDQEFVKKMLAQKDGELSYEWNGQQKWMIFRSFDGGKDWKWRVAYSIYNKVKFADARELFFNLLMIMVGITVLIIIILAFYMTNQIARPVRMLTECAKKAATGDVDMTGVNEKQLESVRQRKDELGNTLRAFDTLLTAQKEKINVAQAISAGDLTCHVNISSEHDKLGIALRAMNQRLNEMVQSISTTATSIASGSQEISSSSQLLSDGATRQAASLQEISSSMTDMATQAKTSAEGAEYAQSLSIDARDSGKTGNAKMISLVAQMGNINVSADSITKVIKTIDSIAFQTNLLALNAAVEAARAGNHGKGFAVVAEEVRNLASRSAKAAQETAKLIQKTVDMITQGNEMAKDTATVLEQIVENTTKVADIAGESAATSNEQAQGIAQITQGVQQVSDVTQQNTASAEEAASASSEMASLAAQLQALVNRFQLETQTEATPAQHIAPISRRAPKLSTQAKPRHIPPAPKQQPTQQKNIHDDWGQSSTPKPPATSADIKGTVIDDSIEIKLDDEEFGKY